LTDWLTHPGTRWRRVAALLLAAAVFWCLLVPGCRGRRAGPEPTVSLYNHETGEKQSLKMEEYICGVVAGEMHSDWPLEALAAQAILARTFTMERLERTGGVKELHGTDVCTDENHFQAYDAAAINEDVRRAVERTRGMVATYQGKYIHAWFHSCAGGKTATAGEGLDYNQDPTPYIKPVSDPACPAEFQQWQASIPLEEVGRRLEQSGVGSSQPKKVEVTRRGPSGRALVVSIDGREISGPAFRKALGPERVRSTLFERLEVAGGKLELAGRGFGHGVGMSQWGAYAMARDGRKAEAIIRHYYKGVRLERAWK